MSAKISLCGSMMADTVHWVRELRSSRLWWDWGKERERESQNVLMYNEHFF